MRFRTGCSRGVRSKGSDLVSAGSVHFRETPLGTEVTVSMQYAPPAGKPGAALAWFFGETPAQQLREGLERLQRELEQKPSEAEENSNWKSELRTSDRSS